MAKSFADDRITTRNKKYQGKRVGLSPGIKNIREKE